MDYQEVGINIRSHLLTIRKSKMIIRINFTGHGIHSSTTRKSVWEIISYYFLIIRKLASIVWNHNRSKSMFSFGVNFSIIKKLVIRIKIRIIYYVLFIVYQEVSIDCLES